MPDLERLSLFTTFMFGSVVAKAQKNHNIQNKILVSSWSCVRWAP
jgi:hypothetical protein